MRKVLPKRLEECREHIGAYASDDGDLFGVFFITGPNSRLLKILSSGIDHENGWEHVSVSLDSRTPNWREMCFVKDLFWDEDECVVQYHPPKSDYVNVHPNCLHLWRPVDGKLIRPPSHLVGPK